MNKLFLLLAAALAFSSCSVIAIRKHEPNFKNTRELAKAKGSFYVAAVESVPELGERMKSSSLSCRLTTFNVPAGDTVASYLKNGLTDEFDAAEKLNPKGTAVSLLVKGFDSNTAGFSRGDWQLDIDYLVNKKTINVKTVTEFESAYAADTACRNTANALTDAMRDNFAEFFKKLPR